MIRLTMRATATCEHTHNGRGCTTIFELQRGAEEMSVARFADLFREELESSGWQTFGGVMCPEHSRPLVHSGDDSEE